MRKMVSYIAVSVTEYSDGENSLMEVTLDPTSGRFCSTYLGSIEQPARDPFQQYEMLAMAAMEVFARRTGHEGQLSL